MARLSLAIPLLLALAAIDGGSYEVRNASAAAQESLLNCNQLQPEDRCDCNRRVLRALLESRVAASDPVQSANSTPASVQATVQQEYRHRLRTFIAPGCDQDSSPSNLPAFDPRAPGSTVGNAIRTRFQPLFTQEICGPGCKSTAKRVLEGRWNGWLTLADGKPSAMFMHIIEVYQAFVRACSTHGMIFGVLRDGFLELPGPRSSGLTYTMRLWRGVQTDRDLEGVALLDLRPNQESVGGLVWLSRAPRMLGSMVPTGYGCEDHDLEDERTGKKPPELRKIP